MNRTDFTEPQMDLATLRAFHDVSYNEAGLSLAPEKIKMVQSRLRLRLRACGFADFNTYLSHIQSTEGAEERRQMISVLTTNVSHFFREPHHFDMLCEKILPNIQAKLRAGGKSRIWSAGCSNGQEAFSILMRLLEKDASLASADFKVLATDIDQKVVAFANQAVYADRMLQGVSDERRKKHMIPTEQDGKIAYRMKDDIRKMVIFKELNLLGKWPMRGQFDVIFCRNVLIYFDAKTQQTLCPRFCEALTPEGHLFLGHSERVAEPEATGFNTVGATAYMKDANSHTGKTTKTEGRN